MSEAEPDAKVDTSPERQKSLPLAQRVAHDAPADEVAAAVAAIWRDVDGALRPIIGQRGVAALYDRCIHLVASTYPWLAPGRQNAAALDEPMLDLSALQALLSQQPAATALACGNAMLQSFQRLLSSLVGPLLTERLLRSAWSARNGQSANQDSSS